MKYSNLLLPFFFLSLLACDPSNSTTENDTKDVKEKTLTHLEYEGKKPQKIVFVSGDEEYRSEEALPQLAKILNQQHGFNCTVLFAQQPDNKGTVDPNYTQNIENLDKLEDADLLVLFTRFRALPDEQMQYFQNYLAAGKPLIGIRTATHAFHFKDSTHQFRHWGNYFKEDDSSWQGGFGRLVLGERWHTHHGHHKHQSTRGRIAEASRAHPILNGIADGEIWGSTDVYGVRLPLPDDSQVLLLGEVVERAGEYDEEDLLYGMKESDEAVATVNPASKESYHPNEPMMPIAWLKSYQLPDSENKGTAFTSTIGASVDLLDEEVRRLLVNASYYLLDLEVPEKAKVDLVDDYQPTPYNFHDDAYWTEKNLQIADLK
ncbi:MAG: ThuA domain-containing protein [Bacteroidota bacterium]